MPGIMRTRSKDAAKSGSFGPRPPLSTPPKTKKTGEKAAPPPEETRRAAEQPGQDRLPQLMKVVVSDVVSDEEVGGRTTGSRPVATATPRTRLPLRLLVRACLEPLVSLRRGERPEVPP